MWAVSWAVLSLSCRAPTELTVALSTDFACADLRGTALTVGALHEIETKPSALVTTACADPPTPGRVGSVVLVPSGANSAELAFKVMAGFGRPVADCLKSFGPGCIVARRALRFVPHTPLLVPVLLSSDCDGIACGDTETCAHGRCVPAVIDPGPCAAPGGCPLASDGGALDATVDAPDGTMDATVDATVDATGDAGTIYHDMSIPSNGTTFDLAAVDPAAKGFSGTAFDGRYIYVASGIVTRYDTQGAFGANGAWSTFDLAAVDAGAKSFNGATFDGRYVYFVPYVSGGAADGVVARYDTQGAFGATAAWGTFDLTTVNAGAKGFAGAAFDGRYVYFVPYNNGALDGISARYDTQGAFGATGAWATFDIGSVDAGVKGLNGAAFDGRYVYFVPFDNGRLGRRDALRHAGGVQRERGVGDLRPLERQPWRNGLPRGRVRRALCVPRPLVQRRQRWSRRALRHAGGVRGRRGVGDLRRHHGQPGREGLLRGRVRRALRVSRPLLERRE